MGGGPAHPHHAGRAAEDAGARLGGAGAAPARRPAGALGRRGEALAAPGETLDEDEEDDDGEHDEGELGRAGEVRLVDPGRIDRKRQRPDAEELRGADVVQRLHQGEAGADGDRRAGERQGDAEEDLAAPGAEGARRLDEADRLHQEEGAGREVDVRVEDEAEKQDGAAEGADLRQAEILRARNAEDGADRRLHRPDRVEDVEIGVGDDVGRHGERQEQRPVEDAPAGEVVGRHQPGGAGADRDDDDADAGKEKRRRRHRLGEDVFGEVAPDLGRAAGSDEAERDDGDEDEDRDERRRRSESACPPRREAREGRDVGTVGDRGHLRSSAARLGISRRTRPCRPARSPPCGSWRSRRERASRG